MSISISLDRSAEFHIDARVKVTVAQPAGTVMLSMINGGITSTHSGDRHMYTLPADKQVQLQIAYFDAKGNPAVIDGAVRWDSSDEEIATVEPVTPSPLGAVEDGVVTLTPGTKIGNCQISATADGDLGEGVREIITLMDVTVVGGEAVAGSITPVGEPTPIP